MKTGKHTLARGLALTLAVFAALFCGAVAAVQQIGASSESMEERLVLDAVLADAARTAQGEADYLARVEAALAEAPDAGMTLLGRTVSWTETNDEGRTLICAVELQERGAFPRYVKAIYRLVTDEGEPDGEERLFDAAGEL